MAKNGKDLWFIVPRKIPRLFAPNGRCESVGLSLSLSAHPMGSAQLYFLLIILGITMA